jgi:ABC-2 type transport system ATP-binding protein
MIEVKELTKDYGSRRAVNHLTFEIKKGEIVGFLGPNGAGKTTTMRILTGYIPPTSGEVKIGGYDLGENSLEIRKIIGYLPETVPLYSDMTVFEYLKYMADLRKVKNVKNVVEDVLKLVHLEDRADGYISKLSKGMRQRLGIAQALLHKPDVLILDEPTIGLDPGQIHEVRNLIREMGKERTVLLSTHILSEAQQICDRVLIINKGQLVAEDTTEQLQARLTGSQRVMVRVKGEIDEVIPVIAGTPGVTSVAQKSFDTVEFETLHSEDVSPKVARSVVGGGFDLLEMKSTSMSLEEIFLQLTSEDNSANGSDKEPGLTNAEKE